VCKPEPFERIQDNIGEILTGNINFNTRYEVVTIKLIQRLTWEKMLFASWLACIMLLFLIIASING